MWFVQWYLYLSGLSCGKSSFSECLRCVKFCVLCGFVKKLCLFISRCLVVFLWKYSSSCCDVEVVLLCVRMCLVLVVLSGLVVMMKLLVESIVCVNLGYSGLVQLLVVIIMCCVCIFVFVLVVVIQCVFCCLSVVIVVWLCMVVLVFCVVCISLCVYVIGWMVFVWLLSYVLVNVLVLICCVMVVWFSIFIGMLCFFYCWVCVCSVGMVLFEQESCSYLVCMGWQLMWCWLIRLNIRLVECDIVLINGLVCVVFSRFISLLGLCLSVGLICLLLCLEVFQFGLLVLSMVICVLCLVRCSVVDSFV